MGIKLKTAVTLCVGWIFAIFAGQAFPGNQLAIFLSGCFATIAAQIIIKE